MSQIHQFNTQVKTDIQRKMEKSDAAINRYTVLADKAREAGHSYEEIIAELEAEKSRILTAPFPPNLDQFSAAKVRNTKLACVQSIDVLVKELRERALPKEN